jgi:transcriptional regulator with XRE-family HTH domain
MLSGHCPALCRAIAGDRLRQLRTDAGMTQAEAAAALDWSLSKLARIERGTTGLPAASLKALLHHYGAAGTAELERLAVLARAGRQRTPGGARREAGNLGPGYLACLEHEAAAAEIRGFAQLLVPGLLQTADYARAVFAARDRGHADALAGQLARHQDDVLRRARPPRQACLIDQSALCRHAGGPGAMRRQLLHLAAAATRPGVSVRVVPWEAGAYPGSESFVLLGFGDGIPGHGLFTDNGEGGSFTFAGNDARISGCADDFARIQRMALPADRSQRLIRQLAEKIPA